MVLCDFQNISGGDIYSIGKRLTLMVVFEWRKDMVFFLLYGKSMTTKPFHKFYTCYRGIYSLNFCGPKNCLFI